MELHTIVIQYFLSEEKHKKHLFKPFYDGYIKKYLSRIGRLWVFDGLDAIAYPQQVR